MVADGFRNPLGYAGGVCSDFALPGDDHEPPRSLQLGLVAQVPGDISFELCLPPILAGGRKPKLGTPFMRMPLAAMDLNNCLPSRQDDIRGPGQIAPV
jgi:hypothetical protein